jgi:paraquat-inducible protein B
MSKKANPAVIGAFVVGALALLAVGVALFGGSQLFARKSQVFAYFEGSVKGLRVGSNVLFRGVRIGFVSDIQLMGSVETLQPMVRTTLDLTPGVWVLYRNGKRLPEDAADMISAERLVDAGLRARLGIESFVTGQLVIELDFLPDTKPVLRGLKGEGPNEIPTVPSSVKEFVDQVQKFIERIDFDRLQANLQGALEGLNELANSKDAREALAGLNRFANNDSTQDLPANIEATMEAIRRAAQDVGKLAESLDTEAGSVATELKAALQELDGALASAKLTLDSVERQVRGDSGFGYQLTSTLVEVREAARSLRTFMEFIDQHPEALIRGKKKPKE